MGDSVGGDVYTLSADIFPRTDDANTVKKKRPFPQSEKGLPL
jgi:hypothetical protein